MVEKILKTIEKQKETCYILGVKKLAPFLKIKNKKVVKKVLTEQRYKAIIKHVLKRKQEHIIQYIEK